MSVDLNIMYPDFLSGGGEMGERLRTFDWSATYLGPLEKWPQSLRTTVSIALACNFPIAIIWGVNHIQLYNDGYLPFLGVKHPKSLSQHFAKCWKEAWPEIGKAYDRAWLGETSYLENVQTFINRHGFLEEIFVTFSFSPIRDESGGVGGVFHPVTEHTEKALSERRNKALRDLSLHTSEAKTTKDVFTIAAQTLSAYDHDLPFVMFYNLEADKNEAMLVCNIGVNNDTEAIPQSVDLQTSNSWPFARVVAMRTGVLVNNVDAILGQTACGPFEEMPHTAFVLPITAPGIERPIGFIVAGVSARLPITDEYISFLHLVAATVSAAVANAEALEEAQKRADALAAIDKAKTAFFTNISHEFRTPLTLMLGSLEELLKGESIGDTRTTIETTHRNSLRLLKLVNNLLDFSRLEAGRVKATYSLIDISTFTVNIAASFRSAIEAAGLSFDVLVDTINQPVYIDIEMWEKIVLNILSNAFKYTLSGKITLSLNEKDNTFILTVSDTGVGIPETELPKMFERFHRVEHSEGRTFEGTGIGLSLVKELVDLHSGTISVGSQEGKGSTFKVTIPTGKIHLANETVSETANSFEAKMSSAFIEEASSLIDVQMISNTIHKEGEATILIVDDNTDMRTYISSLLYKNFNILTAKNGKDALQQLTANKVDLVLSDVMMPVMDGIALLKEIKQNPKTEDISVILLTARAGEESKIEGFETGADDYLVKPFSSRELIARVRAQIDLKDKRAKIINNIYNLFDSVPFAVAVFKGEDLIIDYINQSTLDLWQKQLDEVNGKPLFEARPDLKGLIENIHADIYRTGKSFITTEMPVEMPTDGKTEIKYFDAVIDPIYNDNGKIIGQLATSIDVTEKVLARRKLEDSENRFRSIVEKSLGPVCILQGEDMILRLANEPLFNAWHTTKEEAVGKPLLEILPELHNQPYMGYLLDVYHNDVTIRLDEQPAYLVRKDGSEYTAFFNFIYQPYKEDGENIKGVLVLASDVTEQVNARKKIEESEREANQINEQLELSISAGKIGVWYWDVVEDNVKWNKEQFNIYGLENDEFSGTFDSFLPFIHKDDLALFNSENKLGSLQEEYEFRIIRKDGAERWIKGMQKKIYFDNGALKSMMGVNIDITDHKEFSKRLEEEVANRTIELLQTNKELESFNYIASHDLQEPLRKIQTFIPLLKKNIDDVGKREIYFEKIVASSQRMSALIQSLLNYSHLSKSQKGKFKITNLNDVFIAVKSDFELRIQETEADIICDILPTINANTSQIEQLFSNLISNSMKFAVEKPVIKIGCKIVSHKDINIINDKKLFVNGSNNEELKKFLKSIDPEKKYVALSFEDNGIGFETEYAHKIFDLFQRLHNKIDFQGTGIGLSIVKKIVEQHHGFVSATSQLNIGTTFTVWLPL